MPVKMRLAMGTSLFLEQWCVLPNCSELKFVESHQIWGPVPRRIQSYKRWKLLRIPKVPLLGLSNRPVPHSTSVVPERGWGGYFHTVALLVQLDLVAVPLLVGKGERSMFTILNRVWNSILWSGQLDGHRRTKRWQHGEVSKQKV